MFVLSVCVNDTVHLPYILVFSFLACEKTACDELWFIM